MSFVELEKRIREIPEGPGATMGKPPWMVVANAVGTLGIVLGLAPSLLVYCFEPAVWMVWTAKIGLWLAGVGFLPSFLWESWFLARSLWRWNDEQPRQLDHAFAELTKLSVELSQLSEEVLSARLRFTRQVQARLSAKLGFLAGGLDKLGILPLIIALALQLKAYGDPFSIPGWQAVSGVFVVLAYLVAMAAALMRIRIQLYEVVLEEALHLRESKNGQPGLPS